jgi:hypothetical protein
MKDIDNVKDEMYPFMIEDEDTRSKYVVPFATAVLNADESSLGILMDEIANEYKATIEKHYESFIDYASEIICDLDDGIYISDDFGIADEKKTEYENALSLIIMRTNMVCHDKIYFAMIASETLITDPPTFAFNLSSITSNTIFTSLRKKIMSSTGLWWDCL